MIFTRGHAEFITYHIKDFTPLELAEGLGLTFKQVADFCDRESLEYPYFRIARRVKKATLADAYYPPEEA